MTSDEFIDNLLRQLPVPPEDLYCEHSRCLAEDGETVVILWECRSGRTAGLVHRLGEEPATPITYLD